VLDYSISEHRLLGRANRTSFNWQIPSPEDVLTELLTKASLQGESRQVARITPNRSGIGRFLDEAATLMRKSRFSEAIDSFDLALELDSSNADAWYFKGLVLSNGLGKYDEGIAAFDKALESRPSYADAWINRGMALGNAGRFDESISSFDKAIEINPRDPVAWNNKGVVLREKGNYKEAMSCFDQALELNPSYEVAQENKKRTRQVLNQDNFYELDDILYKAKQREGSLME